MLYKHWPNHLVKHNTLFSRSPIKVGILLKEETQYESMPLLNISLVFTQNKGIWVRCFWSPKINFLNKNNSSNRLSSQELTEKQMVFVCALCWAIGNHAAGIPSGKMRRPGSEPEVLSRYESGYAAVLLYTHSLYPHNCNSAGFSFDFGFNFTPAKTLCPLTSLYCPKRS